MSDLERQIIKNFRDREYRESYAEGFLNSWISHQLAAIRRQRGLTQSQLAERVGTKQSGVSRMERDDYGRWNFSTLQKVAFALGCRLKVSLETFGALVKEAAEFSEASFRRPAFEEDPVFHEGLSWDAALAEPGPLGEMRRKLIPWLRDRGPSERLAEWLQGYDLPAVGDEVTPSQWLLDALTPPHEELRTDLAARVRTAIIDRRWDVDPPGRRGAVLVNNLMALVEGLRQPAILGEAVWSMCQRRAHLPLADSKHPAPGHPLVRAVLYNQPDGCLRDFWYSEFLAEREPREMPDYVANGLIGVSYMGSAPNTVGIMEGANEAKNWSLKGSQVVGILAPGFKRVWSEFASNRDLAVDSLWLAQAREDGWSVPILDAWQQSVADDPPPQKARTHGYVQNAVSLAEQSRYSAR